MKGRRSTPHFRKILVGYDGSTQAERAVEVALLLARSLDAMVLIFAVAHPPEPPVSVELEAFLDNAHEHYEESFKGIRRYAGDDVELATEIAVGHPAEQIVHKAETENFDLIILGRRGLSRFERWRLGSVSERVLRYAHCPVMVIPLRS
jgi:nucleotide-binding universal stress UspA family protein